MKIAMIIVMFLAIGALFIISNDNLALKDPANFDEFKESYALWLSEIFDNGKTITGYVINSNWLPDSG